MLHFEGDRDIVKAPAEVWARLSDGRFLVQCIPNAEITGEPTPTTAACQVRPGLSFVRGTLHVTLRVEEAVEPSSVRLALDSKGIGASSKVEANLAIAAHEAGSRVHWTADVKSLGGLLKLVPQGLIRGAAQSVINDVWAQVDHKIMT
jgi:carbon monoxide dehydrogenase subunit G